MTDLTAKQQILQETDYRYVFARRLYVNRDLKKAFSIEFIEDQLEAEIARLARDRSASATWQFFFNTKPSESVERELSHKLS